MQTSPTPNFRNVTCNDGMENVRVVTPSFFPTFLPPHRMIYSPSTTSVAPRRSQWSVALIVPATSAQGRTAPLLPVRDEAGCRSPSEEPGNEILSEHLVVARTQLHVRSHVAWPVDERERSSNAPKRHPRRRGDHDVVYHQAQGAVRPRNKRRHHTDVAPCFVPSMHTSSPAPRAEHGGAVRLT